MSPVTDQIKDRIDITDVVREYVPELKKAGANWKARCPFHQEKTPSFTANPDKGIWHCFGCSKGGDVFSFIQEIEGVEFPDALRMLADRAGIKLEKTDRTQESKRSRMLELLRHAVNWYHQALLKSKSGTIAREYVAGRAVSEKTRDAWLLGFAPDAWEGVSLYLKSRGFGDDEIEAAGLSSSNDRGSRYDRFRNRLMFPITDVHGSVVGFTARKLAEEDQAAKYINTPETAVYKKSSVLYGLSQAKQSIRTLDLAVIVEGNMDCLSSHQAGITNVVASSGTALTPEQINLLKRYTKNISLAFDPDAAGQTAAVRGLEVAWQQDISISVVRLPEGADPDSLIKQDPKLWEHAIAERVDLLEWVFERANREYDVSSAAGKKGAARMVLSWIARLSDPIEQAHYLQKLSILIRVDEAVLRGVLAKSRRYPSPQSSPQRGEGSSLAKPDILEQVSSRAVALASIDPACEVDPETLVGDPLKELYKKRSALYDTHINELDESLQSWARMVVMIAEEYRKLPPEKRQSEFQSLSRRLAAHHIQSGLKRIRGLIHEAEQAGDLKTLEARLAEWQQLNRDLQHHHTYASKKEDPLP